MRPLNVVCFYMERLHARRVQELFAVLGIGIGVALLFASQVANTSLSGSVAQLTNGIAGNSRLQLQARGPQGFDERVLGEVRRLPGVRRAAPVVVANANLVGPSGRRAVYLIGADPSFAHLGGVLLRHLTSAQLAKQRALVLPGPIARQIGAEPLQVITMQIDGRSVRVLVGLTLQVAEIGALVRSPVALAPLAYAQRLAGMQGRVSRILIQPEPGDDGKVRAEVSRLAGGSLYVRPADSDAALFSQAEGPTNQSTQLFAVVSALVGFLFAFNALLLTVPQRRGLIADLRLDGYAPWEVVEVLLFDALLLGVVGSLVGLLLGDWLSHHLLEASPGYLALAFPVGSQRIVDWQCFAVAVGGGLLAAGVGVLHPLRDIFARAPLTSREPAAPSRSGIVSASVAGLACLAVTTTILLAGIEALPVAVAGFVALVAAMLLLLPALLGVIVAGFDWLQRRAVGVSTRLAVIELQSSSARVRSAAIAATGAVAVFGSVAIEGAQSNLQSGLNRVDVEVNRVADLWVSPAGVSGTLATTPFGAGGAGMLARLPEVASVRLYRGSFLDVGDHRALVIAPPRASAEPIPPSQIMRGTLAQATVRLREHGWATVSRTIADELRLRVGEPFTLPTPRPTTFRLAAVTTNFGWPPGAIIVNADDYARAWGSQDPSAYQLDLKPGVQPSLGSREIQQALAGSGLAVQTAAQRERSDRAAQHQGLARLEQIARLVLIAAVLAMAAAMGAMIWQRRPRLAGMKVDGYDDGELWRALLCETALLLGAGCSIGALFGLYGQLLLSHALATVTGFPVVFSVAAPTALGAFALVATTAVAIVAIPGYLAARVEPALQS
jgi:putative ABC transport system permease protein